MDPVQGHQKGIRHVVPVDAMREGPATIGGKVSHVLLGEAAALQAHGWNPRQKNCQDYR
jgi:hypothetical protein